jgi:glycosyltransferase involved in cell wall biosynthesis
MSGSERIPLLSVITPVYNGAPLLRELIESVLEQDNGSIEHIVIDDGSTDDGATVEILKEYAHLRWWSRENRGQYATMNEGLREARGKYVCFISADDLMAEDAIQAVLASVQRLPETDVLYGRVRYIDENNQRYPVQPILHRSSRVLYRYLANIAHCTLWAKRTFLLQHELWFNEELCYIGDYDWIIRILDQRPACVFVKQTLASVRVHSSQTSISAEKAVIDQKNAYYSKHGINGLFLSLINFVRTLRSAVLRLFHELRVHGWKGFLRLLRYFVLHKFGKA